MLTKSLSGITFPKNKSKQSLKESKMAQPTNQKFKFTEDHAKIILEMGKHGASQKSMYSAIGISKTTALKLKKEDPDFAEAMDLATTYGQAFWETMMLANIENKAFNSRVAEIALRGQYPDDYKDTREQKIDLKAEVVVDFNKEIANLISALKQ